MTKLFPELLNELNANPALLADPKYRQNMALVLLFKYAYVPELKFVLPEGVPPFRKDAAPLGMSAVNLLHEVKKLYIYSAQRTLPSVRRQQLFINLLENVHPSEAYVLLAVKEQNLTTLYPNLTKEAVEAAGYLK